MMRIRLKQKICFTCVKECLFTQHFYNPISVSCGTQATCSKLGGVSAPVNRPIDFSPSIIIKNVVVQHRLTKTIELKPKTFDADRKTCAFEYKSNGNNLKNRKLLLSDTKNSEPLYIRAFRRLGNK